MLLYEILRFLGYRQVLYNSPTLINTAETVMPGSLLNVKMRYGRPLTNVSPPRYILESVFGLDDIYEIGDEFFGFAWVCNHDEIEPKLNKLNNSQPLWEALKVKKVGLVLFEACLPFWKIGFLNNKEFEILEDQLVKIIYKMDESPLLVTQHKVVV